MTCTPVNVNVLQSMLLLKYMSALEYVSAANEMGDAPVQPSMSIPDA